MMTTKCIVSALAAALIFSGCTAAPNSLQAESISSDIAAPITSSSSESSAAAEIKVESEASKSKDSKYEDFELVYGDSSKILYRFIPESELYDISKLLEFEDEADYNDIFNTVTDVIFPGREIPAVNSITQKKENIIFDFSQDWLDAFNKGELYEFCNTLVMTLSQNGFCESVSFKIDGKSGLLGEEVWETAKLRIIDTVDASKFAEIRAQIPYSGSRTNGGESYFDFADDIKNDSMAQKIHHILKAAGELTNQFDHPNDMDMKKAVLSLIWATEPIYTDAAEENYDLKTTQTIMPIVASVSQRLGMQESCFWLKEHIEQTARNIFGNDVVIEHQNPLMKYRWFEDEGVYTPPHMGGGWHIIPHLYSYSVEGNTVTAEVAYLRETMQGFYNAATEKYMEDYDDVENYLENDAPRHIVTLNITEDGRLTVRQHHLSNPGGN